MTKRKIIHLPDRSYQGYSHRIIANKNNKKYSYCKKTVSKKSISKDLFVITCPKCKDHAEELLIQRKRQQLAKKDIHFLPHGEKLYKFYESKTACKKKKLTHHSNRLQEMTIENISIVTCKECLKEASHLIALHKEFNLFINRIKALHKFSITNKNNKIGIKIPTIYFSNDDYANVFLDMLLELAEDLPKKTPKTKKRNAIPEFSF